MAGKVDYVKILEKEYPVSFSRSVFARAMRMAHIGLSKLSSMEDEADIVFQYELWYCAIRKGCKMEGVRFDMPNGEEGVDELMDRLERDEQKGGEGQKMLAELQDEAQVKAAGGDEDKKKSLSNGIATISKDTPLDTSPLTSTGNVLPESFTIV